LRQRFSFVSFFREAIRSIDSASFTVKDITPPVLTIISPVTGSLYSSEIPIAVSVQDDATGAANAEYRIDNGTWLPLPASDNFTGRYSTFWMPVKADEGSHIISFRATDNAGNISLPVSTSLTVKDVQSTGKLAGNVTVRPSPAYPGQDITLSYSITNNGVEDSENSTVAIKILNSETRETKQTFQVLLAIPAGTAVTGNFIARISDVTPQTYEAILIVTEHGVSEPEELAKTTFEVRPKLETRKMIRDATNLLVWINTECTQDSERHSPRYRRDWKNGNNECVKTALIEDILRQTVSGYFITAKRSEFQKELRNPFYTDILILGDKDQPEYLYMDELREQVYAGRGLISALFLKQNEQKRGAYSSLHGLRYSGEISARDLTLNIPVGFFPEQGSIQFSGRIAKVGVDAPEKIAAWIDTDNMRYPGIVTGGYGEGRTIFYAFDLASMLDDDNFSVLSSVLINSLLYIHTPLDTGRFYPFQTVPVATEIAGMGGGFDLRITETYPPEVKLLDQAHGTWITESPWITDVHIEHDETKSITYNALLTNNAGTYTLRTDVEYSDNIVSHNQSSTIDIAIEKDTASMSAEILHALNALDASARDAAKIRQAIRYIRKIQKKTVSSSIDVEMNIRYLMRTIQYVRMVRGVATREVLLMLDRLLLSFEGMYYYYEKMK
jgi:hypothetical protein